MSIIWDGINNNSVAKTPSLDFAATFGVAAFFHLSRIVRQTPVNICLTKPLAMGHNNDNRVAQMEACWKREHNPKEKQMQPADLTALCEGYRVGMIPVHCVACDTDHGPLLAHNLLSPIYEYGFRRRHGRAPTWADAIAHCPYDLQQLALRFLSAQGAAISTEELRQARQTFQTTSSCAGCRCTIAVYSAAVEAGEASERAWGVQFGNDGHIIYHCPDCADRLEELLGAQLQQDQTL